MIRQGWKLSVWQKKREADVDEEEYNRFLECLATLTRKEKEILDLYVKGYSSKDILET